MTSPNALYCSIFLITAFVIAGFAQTFWLKSRISRRFQVPLDGGKRVNGQRILGDNKTWRGFIVMVPAAALSFVVVRLLFNFAPWEWSAGLWRLSLVEYGLLGAWSGFGFMAGELPNSFVKRQLGIAAGRPPRHFIGKPICFLIDRLDSIAGGLLALALFVTTPLWTWLCLLFVGPAFHLSFSLLLFRLGVKARPA